MKNAQTLRGFSRPRSAFTLIELLVVISIIAVLAGLAFPAVNGAIDSAKKAKAKNDVTQIVAAIKAYQAEYGKLPVWSDAQSDQLQADNNNLFDILRGKTAGQVNNYNPRMLAFIEIRPGKGPKDGLGPDGVFYDPWGKPYLIKFDTDYDNEVEYKGVWVGGSAVAVSSGKNGTNEDNLSASGVDDVFSFR